ncbi:MAG: hypothetical protein ABFC94_11955 [Syntrophomonas sp.]
MNNNQATSDGHQLKEAERWYRKVWQTAYWANNRKLVIMAIINI